MLLSGGGGVGGVNDAFVVRVGDGVSAVVRGGGIVSPAVVRSG